MVYGCFVIINMYWWYLFSYFVIIMLLLSFKGKVIFSGVLIDSEIFLVMVRWLEFLLI